MRLIVLLLLVPGFMLAAEQESSTYVIPSDVQPSGGGEEAQSANYRLSDTIGEPAIGPSFSDSYSLSAGYRATLDHYLSLTCGFDLDVGTIDGDGQSTGSGTCVVATDAPAGYSLGWEVRAGSGGTATGSMISELEDVIPPYTPDVAGTPEPWSIEPDAAEWGGRLSSRSTDTDDKWGIDGVDDKWLNVGTGTYTLVQRPTRTDLAGSTEILDFRVQVGSSRIQPTGTYDVGIVFTASAL